MEITTCSVCCKNKTALHCDACGKASCKYCSYFIDEDSFEFIEFLPENVRDKAFCPNCYNESVSSILEEYQEALLRAKDVNVYEKDQAAEIRFIKRVEDPIVIEECDDREETLMRLAFLAAQKGYGTIIEVALKSKKVSAGGKHRKLVWSGTAIPVDPDIKTRKKRKKI